MKNWSVTIHLDAVTIDNIEAENEQNAISIALDKLIDDPSTYLNLPDDMWFDSPIDLARHIHASDGDDLLWKCKVCGCTAGHACEGGCFWVEKELCSVCALSNGVLFVCNSNQC